MEITINPEVTPTFAQIGPLCQNETAPLLSGVSDNGITGIWSPATINTATAGTTTYTFTPDAGQCAVTVTMDITISPEVTPTFAQIGPLCQNETAPLLPSTSDNGITGVWSPATINTATAGTTTYTFTPDAGQCAVVVTMDIEVTDEITPTFTQVGPFCLNATAPPLPTTSDNGITGVWSPATINTATAGTTTYTFTPDAGQCAVVVTMDIEVTDEITPTFTQVGPFCLNATAPPLPTTSDNGITGVWSPATINTATAGTTTYTFTPDAGQCATSVTMDITINPEVTPTFAQVGPFCLNATAAPLPTTSDNGITGVWSPATINTATAGTTTYTFTPDAGQCAVVVTMDIEVTDEITPTFTQVGPFCLNATAPPLPTTSDNGITGVWSPATINTATAGTTTYTFTPDAGQCAVVVTMDIEVTDEITPTFTQVGPFCLNATAPPLPTTSDNGITGVWSPATINTATAGTTTYTFTPDAGQCAVVVTMDIEVTDEITPTFTQVGPFCLNATAPPLPTTSDNGITGVWSPATINTATAGTTTYTFTPDAGQCAVVVTMDIEVTDEITPTFTQVGPFCLNATAPPLPTTSDNGITGVWSPATINTATAGTTTYTFTPDAGQCAVVVTMDIEVTDEITPTFTQVDPFCLNATAPPLPTTSDNGITGVWSPATINTATAGTTTYTFTPDAGQCAVTVTMDIEVTDEITPTFTQVGPFCLNATAPPLPTTSDNGITGVWSPATINTATAGTTTYTFTPDAGQCAVVVTMDIEVTDEITPTFTQVGPFCLNATAPPLPTTSDNGITGVWSPATINTATAGTTTYTFTPDAGQCAVVVTMDIEVTDEITPTFTQVGPFCLNATAPPLPTTSDNGITGVWSPATINTATAGTTTYTFTPDAGQCATSVTMDITINPEVTPTFAQVGPFCLNATAAPLPTTSDNGITGVWSPATINTATAGTTTYTFTPDAGQCAVVVTMDIEVTDEITPTFTQVDPFCLNATAPPLPTTSDNGITGVWSPATINTATAGTTTYTFTPDAGQCAVTVTMDIEVTDEITPTFTQVGPFCLNATAPPLPTTSDNGITGVWSPATINTATAGTTTYTFTPDAGQCAVVVTMDIEVTDEITPTFTQVGPFCLNATAPPLPTTSDNGITGVWSPATINTATAGTTTYTFTPDAGQCAVVVTMDIEVTDEITPTFTQVDPFCLNATAPPLPTTSDNGITGVWSPATINTATAGTTTYTFTPDAGQCAVTVTMDIEVTDEITPTFTQVGPFCLNATAPPLPTTSDNGITGVWSPATINTATAGTTTYTFTPDAGQCAVVVTMDIEVTDEITPTFTQVGPFCLNATAPPLPTTSDNGITGVWSPATINTATAGTTTYTFTPDAGQCATSVTMDITINPEVTPTFAQVGPFCLNATAAPLPTTSDNGITGVWSPATINTATAGTTTYTFTPDAGQCAVVVTMDIEVTDEITPTFTQVGPFCLNATAPPLPTTSDNGITGVWSPATINTATAGTTTYTFTPDAGQCAVVVTMDIEVTDEITPTFTQVGPFCLNATAPPLPTTSDNGITGVWSPATINTATAGTTTYTFTPDAGQCAVVVTMDIEVTDEITPTFTQVDPFCLNATAPPLPTTSDNGITGVWSPATINTATAGTTTYTFTPDAGQCAVVVTMDIEVTDEITPTFTQVGPFCLNATAPPLPTTSDNGITGVWSPATINTATAGTTTYTFTPDAGQCAVVVTMDIEVTDEITPTFTQVDPFCLNATAPPLPTTSDNGITGVWSPATINTATAGTTTYTFTPDAGQCAVVVTMDIEVTDEITPTFTQVGPFCLNATAPPLPTTSDNGITGVWSPATINTATAGTTTYTFTPDAGQCAVTVTMDIEVTDEITPTFTQVGPFCLNATAPSLPTTSDNGITGVWSPATINTATAGTTTYTFTPDAGQCAVTVTMDIEVTDEITPTFTQVGPFCLNATAPSLPTTSDNGITGVWSPATINTATAGTTTYTFTPDAGQCAVTVTMDIEVTDEITPTFTQVGPFCLNATAP